MSLYGPDDILRRIFPSRSQCPDCGHRKYRRSGNSKSGDICYRTCLACRTTYRVWRIAIEVDRGGLVSEIVRD